MEKREAYDCLARAFDHLHHGRWDEGWSDYEARFDAWGQSYRLPQAPWRGEPLEGKSILVFREQGIGEEILFASCVPELVERSASCIVTCAHRLRALFRRSFPDALIRSWESSGKVVWMRTKEEAAALGAIGTDYQTPAGSVPRYLRRHTGDFPSVAGYLVPDRRRLRVWRERLAALGPGPKIGISWQGGKDLANLRRVPWEIWRQIVTVPGACFVNLQYGDCARQLETMRRQWGVEVHDWEGSDRWWNLDALAAQIAALDLVITVPNATAHMAGAVGTPVWIFSTPRWRRLWITDAPRVPWYPSARVFADRGGDWQSALGSLLRELSDRLG